MGSAHPAVFRWSPVLGLLLVTCEVAGVFLACRVVWPVVVVGSSPWRLLGDNCAGARVPEPAPFRGVGRRTCLRNTVNLKFWGCFVQWSGVGVPCKGERFRVLGTEFGTDQGFREPLKSCSWDAELSEANTVASGSPQPGLLSLRGQVGLALPCPQSSALTLFPRLVS